EGNLDDVGRGALSRSSNRLRCHCRRAPAGCGRGFGSQTFDGRPGAGAQMVRRRHAESVGAQRGPAGIKRLLSRPGISYGCGAGWIFNGDRNTRFDRLAIVALWCYRLTPDVRTYQPVWRDGLELDDGQDWADLPW